jgi:hypothetical protein
MLFSVETIASIVGRKFKSVSLRLAGCLGLSIFASYWWLFMAGTEHRYLFPFILMIIIWLLPDVLERLREASTTVKSAVACYCLVPAFLLPLLLWSPRPPVSLQSAMGINLSTGQYAFEVQVGQQLLSEAEQLARSVNVYSLGNIRAGVVEMIDWVQSVESRKASRKFNMGRPLNWVDMPGLRLQEITQSDFLIMEDVRSQDGSSITVASISDWHEEVERFKQFIYFHHNVERNGLELLFDGSVKVLKVVNKERFANALHLWAKSICWENDFPERNAELFETRR